MICAQKHSVAELNNCIIHRLAIVTKFLTEDYRLYETIDMSRLVFELIYEKIECATKVKVREVYQMIKAKNFWVIIAYLADIFRQFNFCSKNM